MKAIQIAKDRKIEVIKAAAPKLKTDEVIVRPLACGICGTDLHICEHGFRGTNSPVTPGHEFAGHVASVGRDVASVTEGDFVAVKTFSVWDFNQAVKSMAAGESIRTQLNFD